MTKEQLRQFGRELDLCLKEMDGQLEDEPRYQLTGEIIPKSLLQENEDTDYSEQR